MQLRCAEGEAMKKLNGNFKRDRKGERGSILAMSALGMLTVLLAVGLGVDVSKFYMAKAELQNAADAAALAGVSGLNGSGAGITQATNRAVQQMNRFHFNHDSVSFSRANIQFAVNLAGPYISEAAATAAPTNIRFVRVTTPASAVPVSFAMSVLGSSRDLRASATAGFSVPINVFCNWIPLSVIDYDVPMVPGQTYVIRSAPGNKVSPGNYQILAVAGRGGKDVRQGLASGVDLCAEPGHVYEVDTKPGVTSGPVRQGINTRFDDYSGGQVNPTDHPPDANIYEGIPHWQYLQNNPFKGPKHPSVEGRRIVIIPIVKLAEYDQGRNTVKFDRFGQFFLKTKVGNGNGGDIEAEYIDDIVVAGKGGFNPNGGAANNLMAVPVLYK
jgi:Flp pilus assembly protein TadG